MADVSTILYALFFKKFAKSVFFFVFLTWGLIYIYYLAINNVAGDKIAVKRLLPSLEERL
jgi:hypothetical protein